MRRSLRFIGFGLIAIVCFAAPARAGYDQTFLVSDIQGLAANYDPNLRNPWGVSYAPTGPFWVSDNNNSLSTLYNGAGKPISSTVVTIPTTPGNGPTGQVWNGNASDFVLSDGQSARFLFANENGSISAWNPGLGAMGTAQQVITAAGASFTGLAIAAVNGNNVLYAADAANNKIDVYNSSFAQTTLTGNFQDSKLAGLGFSVFNVQTLGNNVYVTYNNAAGGGAVATFDQQGNLIRDFSNGASGPLQNPWGIAIAPTGFGQFSGDLLVGNKEQGTINAYDPMSGSLLGTVTTIQNTVAGDTDAGLWALTFGNGGNGGSVNTLYAFAGINNENDGLMVAITPSSVPEPGSAVLATIGGAIAMAFARRRRASKQI